MSQPRPAPAAWLPWMLVPLAMLGFSVLWVLLALYSGRQCNWMAVLAALDMLWVLGLGRPMPPARRAALATACTLVIIGMVNWVVAATYAGSQVGLSPWEATLRLGLDHGLTLAGLANAGHDAAWLAIALAVAAGGPFLSARRRAPSAR